MSNKTKQDKDKKKKQQEDWLTAQIIAIMEKSLKAALDKAMDDLFSDFK